MKWTMLTILLLTLASCKSEQLDPTLTAFFPEDAGEIRKPDAFADAQAASGARNDATLHKLHFDGPRLNSLGEAKLAAMLKDDDACEPLTVYLDVPDQGDAASRRKDAVVTFLRDTGLAPEQIAVVYGDNPDTRTPAARFLPYLGKAETGAKTGGTDDAASDTGNGMSGPSGSDGGLIGASTAK